MHRLTGISCFCCRRDDNAHFVVAAVERVRLGAFRTNPQAGGKPQYHPRLMLALLIHSYASGVFSSRRIERATWRDIGARFIAANTHPDHDTITVFQRTNKQAFEAAFLEEVLLLARETRLLKLSTVSIDGTKIDANAPKIRSARYDRAQALREKLATDIAELTAQAEAADAEDIDPQRCRPSSPGVRRSRPSSMPPVPGRRPRRGPRPSARHTSRRRGFTRPCGAGAAVRPSRLRRRRRPAEQFDRSRLAADAQVQAHEYRQAYNAQAVVCADGSQLILATNMATTPNDQPTFAATILAMEKTIGLPQTVLADAGFASAEAVARLEAHKIEPLVVIAHTQPYRPYDFRPPPEPKPERRITGPWRIAMKAKLASDDGKTRYKKRKQTVENRSSASSRARWASSASISAASRMSSPSGCSLLWPTTAVGTETCSRSEPDQPRQPMTTRTRQAARALSDQIEPPHFSSSPGLTWSNPG